MTNADRFDCDTRRIVYDTTLQRGTPPSMVEVALALAAPPDDVRASFQRLAAGRVLVLQGETGEILMAPPFSAVPTSFLVEVGNLSAFGSCIWDALGIAAMLRRDALIRTSCGDCGAAMALRVVGDRVVGEGILHFAVPARDWWEDIVFT